MSRNQVRFWFEKFGSRCSVVPVAVLLLLAAIVAGLLARNEVVNAGPTTAILINQTPQDELAIELGSNGFSPSAVQRPAGTFDITVENSAISGEYTLRLKAEDGTIVKEVSVQKGSVGWTVTLQSGVYTLMEASNPQWQCQITVH